MASTEATWTAQAVLKFYLLFCVEIQGWNEDAQTDFTSLKMCSVYPVYTQRL